MKLTPELFFIIFTFVLIIIIIIIIGNFQDAVLIIIILTNFMVISSLLIKLNKQTKLSDYFKNIFKKTIPDDEDDEEFEDLIVDTFSVQPPAIEKPDIYANYQYAVDNLNSVADTDPEFKSSTREANMLDNESRMAAINRDGPEVAFMPGNFNKNAIPTEPTAYPYDMDNLYSPTANPNPCYDEEAYGAYMDGDEMMAMQQRTQRNDMRRPIVGRILNNKNYYSQFFEEELAQTENRPWWGRAEY